MSVVFRLSNDNNVPGGETVPLVYSAPSGFFNMHPAVVAAGPKPTSAECSGDSERGGINCMIAFAGNPPNPYPCQLSVVWTPGAEPVVTVNNPPGNLGAYSLWNVSSGFHGPSDDYFTVYATVMLLR